VEAAAKREGRADREQAARERVKALGPVVPRLTIDVALGARSAPGIAVKRDGIAVGPPVWGTGAPIDPGEHVVEASAAGKRTWSTKLTLVASEKRVVTIPTLEDETATGQPTAPPKETKEPEK